MKTVSGTAAMLYHDIAAKLAQNDGAPLSLKNPLVVELIDAGVLIETAQRETWTEGGISYLMCVVNFPKKQTFNASTAINALASPCSTT